MNDVRCIRHFVTVMCLGEVGFSALQQKLRFSTHLFAFHGAGDHRNEILSRVWGLEENVCKRTLSQQWCLKNYIHIHIEETRFMQLSRLRKHISTLN